MARGLCRGNNGWKNQDVPSVVHWTVMRCPDTFVTREGRAWTVPEQEGCLTAETTPQQGGLLWGAGFPRWWFSFRGSAST